MAKIASNRLFRHILMLISVCMGIYPCLASTEANTESYRNIALESAYKQFSSYFPDPVLGVYNPSSEERIPTELIREILHSSDENEFWYPVCKIEGYRGFDLFLCEYGLFREDEDSYDNHVDARSILLLFQDGKLLTIKKRSFPDVGYQVGYHYYGEGGETSYDSWFDSDTTLIGYIHLSESESATGYQTPIDTKVKFRHCINEQGELELLEVMNLEFSSPFFLRQYIDEHSERWLVDDYRFHPKQEDKWALTTSIPHSDVNLPSGELLLYFYLQANGNRLETIFEGYISGNMVDRYVLANSTDYHTHVYSKVDGASMPICPVTIETSDGKLELLNNGRLVRGGIKKE